MRQERPWVNWRRHLLLFGSGESDFIGSLWKKGICPPRAGRPRDTESTSERTAEILFIGMLLGRFGSRAQSSAAKILPHKADSGQDNLRSNDKKGTCKEQGGNHRPIDILL